MAWNILQIGHAPSCLLSTSVLALTLPAGPLRSSLAPFRTRPNQTNVMDECISELDAIKQIQEKAEKLQKAFDAMPDYYEKRAGVWDKVGKKESKESKRSDSSSSTKGGKDGDQSSQTHSESTDEKVTDAAGVPDAWLQLASIDVKCYVGLRELAGATAEALLVTADMVDKNGEKIRRPKGNGSDGGSAAFMF
ncbi:unnamed protein product [Phaeothamnion confervicola]